MLFGFPYETVNLAFFLFFIFCPELIKDNVFRHQSQKMLPLGFAYDSSPTYLTVIYADEPDITSQS